MELFPAIDIRDGRCVRLRQGDFDQETTYGGDPVAQAEAFALAGAPWVHVVDLDAARSGEPRNRAVVAAIADAVDVPVQTGGGVRDRAAAEALFAAGVERVVVGTAALEDPEFVIALAAEHRVAVGIDTRAGEVAGHGWLHGSGIRPLELARRFAEHGVDAFVATDIARDGMMSGPDLDGLRVLLDAVPVDVVASGGVGHLAHLSELASLHGTNRPLSGVIVGKALYEGAFTVSEALTVLA